jgi:hypothetical protein
MANTLWLVAIEPTYLCGLEETASASSTPFSGYYIAAYSGGYHPLHWANGIRCIKVFPEGYPPRSNRIAARDSDWLVYKERTPPD